MVNVCKYTSPMDAMGYDQTISKAIKPPLRIAGQRKCHERPVTGGKLTPARNKAMQDGQSSGGVNFWSPEIS